LLCCLCYCVF